LSTAEHSLKEVAVYDQMLKIKDNEILSLRREILSLKDELSKTKEELKLYKEGELEDLKSKIPKKRNRNGRRTIGWAQRLKLASDQDYRCMDPFGKCTLPDLKFTDGIFEVDHKIPFHVSQDDSRENLQCLCPSCHSLKTIDDRERYPY
jgi:CRISPR/Cas system Type II protein with McrA/HNH and RuvC-like nuclease domain